MTRRHVYIKPNYGETIFSMLSREHILSGRVSPLASLKKITSHRGYKPLSTLPSNLAVVCQSLHLEIPPEEFIDKHTLFNLYRPFISPGRRLFVIEGMIGTGAIKSRMGLLKSHCGAADQLAYCAECVKKDVERQGFGYWHREHSFVGIELCPWHNVALTKINLEDEMYSGRNLQLPGNQPSENIWTTAQNERLSYIAQQASIILNAQFKAYITASNYQRILKAKNLVTASNHIRVRPLKAIIASWLEPLSKVGAYKQLFSALSIERDWTANLVAGKEGFHHPLKHIILWGALGIDYFSLMNILQGGEQLPFDFRTSPKKSISQGELVDALSKKGSASSTAEFLGCSINTVLVLMRKYDLSPKIRPKKLKPWLVEKVLNLLAQGYSTKRVSLEANLSVTTVNRIKRSHS